MGKDEAPVVGWRRLGSGWVGLVLGLGLVGWLVWDTLAPGGGQVASLEVGVEALSGREDRGSGPEGKDRFLYSQSLRVSVCPKEGSQGAEEACLGVVERSGEWLGPVRSMNRGEDGCWRLSAPASALSVSHYGPLWVVVVTGPSGCGQLDEVRGSTRDSEQFIQTLEEAMGSRPGWRWGAKRIYVHDKIP